MFWKKKNTTDQSKSKKWMQILPLWVLFIGMVIVAVSNFKDRESLDDKVYFNKQSIVHFISADYNLLAQIDVELANTDYDRQRGLMNREKLEENQGMLFVFPYQDTLSFWMKETKLPLDIIFANSEREIVTIHKNSVPFSHEQYRSSKPAQYVIEVNAGFCDKNGIRLGDRISW